MNSAATSDKMFFRTVLTSLLLTLQVARAQNIVSNPGFEASPNVPASWLVGGPVSSMQPIVSIDTVIKYEGLHGLKMKSMNRNGNGRVFQHVTVTAGTTYRFSARFMANEISSIDKSILIKITWLKGNEKVGYNYIYGITNENDGWFLASGKVKAVESANSAEISLEFRWATGTVWWDNIHLEKCAVEPPRNVKVGTVYWRPPGPTVDQNIKTMAALLDQAGKSHCDIVCLPEGWVTCNTGLAMQKVEENTLNGGASSMMAEKAKQYKMYIVSGLYNWEGDTLYNIAALYDRQGQIQNVYRKVQLPDSEAEQGAVPGNELPVFTTDFGKIGILICWDYAYPEVPRAMALKGAEMLLCPIWGDIRGGNADISRLIARSRAIDNGVFFVSAIYDGYSMIIDPSGKVLQESNKQGTLLTSTIDLNFNPPWDWIGNAGRGVWKGVWRKDRRADIFQILGNYKSSVNLDGHEAGLKNKN